MRKIIFLSIIILVALLFQAQSCNNGGQGEPCPELVPCQFHLAWDAALHTNRKTLGHCNLDFGPVEPCSPAFATWEPSLLGDQSHYDHHLFRIKISGDCPEFSNLDYIYVDPSSTCVDCLTYCTDLPDGLLLNVDIEYIEACNDCYDTNRGSFCGITYRTLFSTTTTFQASSTNISNNTVIVPLSYQGAFCSSGDFCENYNWQPEVVIH